MWRIIISSSLFDIVGARFGQIHKVGHHLEAADSRGLPMKGAVSTTSFFLGRIV